MRDYAKLSPMFWNGNTGKALRGNANAQRVACYLMTCQSANMIGMYCLGLPTLCHEIGISKEGASKGLLSLKNEHFSYYDTSTEYVWVVEMAKWQVGEDLSAKDKRVLGIHRELETHRNSPFFNSFLLRYATHFHLQDIPKQPDEMKGLGKGLTKDLRSQEQEQEQEKEQEQEQEMGSAASPPIAILRLGEFQWARMTEAERDKLKAALNGNFENYVGRFDRWVNEAPKAKANGIKREDRHAYESILNWFGKDLAEGKVKHSETGSKFTPEQIAEATARLKAGGAIR